MRIELLRPIAFSPFSDLELDLRLGTLLTLLALLEHVLDFLRGQWDRTLAAGGLATVALCLAPVALRTASLNLADIAVAQQGGAGNWFLIREPFCVLATQNPIEQEGTYPLPEAQLDRFMVKLAVGYPSVDEEQEILRRRAAIEAGFPVLAEKGWRLLGVGAYFAYLHHPFAISSAELAPKLVRDAGILCLPGTMFCPDGDLSGRAQLRIAFANLDVDGIAELYSRLATFTA